jgi:hypothetical protein
MKERILFGLFFLQCARAKAFHPEMIIYVYRQLQAPKEINNGLHKLYNEFISIR